jgi:hypothetical protein
VALLLAVPIFPLDPLTAKEYVTPETPTHCVAEGHAIPATGAFVVAVEGTSDAAPVAPLIFTIAAWLFENALAPARQSVAVGHAMALVLIDEPGTVEVGSNVAPAGSALNPYKEHTSANVAAAVLTKRFRARGRDRFCSFANFMSAPFGGL